MFKPTYYFVNDLHVWLDSIEVRMKAFFDRASSTVLANIVIDAMDNMDEIEVQLLCIFFFILHFTEY